MKRDFINIDDIVEVLEVLLGHEATKNFMPIQNGEGPVSFANVEDLVRDVGFNPNHH